MTDQRISLALIGCGGIAQSHWRGIQSDAPNVHVTAVVDTDAERAQAMAQQTGARAFTSLREALAEGAFDAVDIMLPHDQHEAAAVACFEAEKHVVLEKPMAMTLDACQCMQGLLALSSGHYHLFKQGLESTARRVPLLGRNLRS